MYREKINENINQVYQAGIATKILQYMNKIRNESDITQARRWVMELLQNAKDLAWPGKPLHIQIELREDALIFRHSGMPFHVKDILSIVNQVSSKNPGEGIGQFGTGFMTTYQLSERVEIHSLLQEGRLPGKEFRITLDRTGRTKDEILNAIARNYEQLQAIDELPDAEYHEPGTEYDTEFCYMLENDRSREIALTGLTDLADTILYVMLFSENIGSVELSFCNGGVRETTVYRRGDCRRISENLEELTLTEEKHRASQKTHTLLFLHKQGMTLAAEYDRERGFLPISERTPRIFVVFPLIGAERFPFPVVANHVKFHPNEPRSGISLVDNPDSQEARDNKALLGMAVKNYETFVRELLQLDTRGIANLIGLFEWQDNREWSETWVKKNLYHGIFKIMEKLPIFSTVQGRLSLADEDLHIIQSENAEEKEGIRRLLSVLRNHLMPDDETDWYKVLEPYQISDGKVIRLENLLQNATTYMNNFLEEDRLSAMEWNHLLYETAMKNPVMATEILAGNLEIFPNQDPEDQKAHRLFTVHQICQDPNIPEILKDAADSLQALDDPAGTGSPFAIRKMLLPREFQLVSGHSMPQYELTSLTEYIRERSSRSYRVTLFSVYKEHCENAWRKAWELLLSCGPDTEMYELCNAWYKGTLPERQKLSDERFSEILWRSTYCSVLQNIMDKIETFSRLEQLAEEFLECPDRKSFYRLLNIFYRKCAIYLKEGELHYKNIFPDQEGRMTNLSSLSKDAVQEEELKEIASCFQGKDPGCNLYRELLDRSVIPEGWNVKIKNDREIAMRISNVVQTLLMECSLSHAELIYQEACTRLLGWIEEHAEPAQEYFPAFYREEDQMKLLTPRAAASIHKKAKGYAKLMNALGTQDPDELEKLLLQAQQLGNVEQECDGAQFDAEFYDESADMWLDEYLLSLDREERDRVCREIGLAGELYIFEQVRHRLLEQGCMILEECQGQITMTGKDAEYIILRPDAEGHAQAGWDIMVIRRPSAELSGDGSTDCAPLQETSWYLEVKTHTVKSVKKGKLSVSNEQMKMAIKHKEHYILLSVVYDYHQRQVQGVKAYEDLCRQLGQGTLVNASGYYCFEEMGQ